jgi:predicted nucleic acid-binding protein
MKIFLDANILISVLNKEYPLFTHTSRILSLSDRKDFEVFTSPVGLAIAFILPKRNINQKLPKKRFKFYLITSAFRKQQKPRFKKH